MSPQFQQGFYDAVATYVRSRDAKAFRSTLDRGDAASGAGQVGAGSASSVPVEAGDHPW